MAELSVLQQTVQAVFVDILNLESPVNWEAVRYQQVEGWDSVAHMAIVAEIEDKLGIMLDTDNILEMSSYTMAMEILGRCVEEMG